MRHIRRLATSSFDRLREVGFSTASEVCGLRPIALRARLHHNRGLARVAIPSASRGLSGLVESADVDQIAIHDEGGDAAGVPDVLGGIAVDDKDVCAAAGSDLTQLTPTKLEAVVVGGGSQRLAR